MEVAVLVGNGVNSGASVGTCASGVALSGAQAVRLAHITSSSPSLALSQRRTLNLDFVIFNEMLNGLLIGYFLMKLHESFQVAK
jgi:hypothetical protein